MYRAAVVSLVLILLAGCRPATPEPAAGETRVRASDGMVMVYVPAGAFVMGSDEAGIEAVLDLCPACQRDWFASERPQHRVYLDAFWMDRTEVTNTQYRKCVEAGWCRAVTACHWGEPTYADASKAGHPAICVEWEDARTYCQWAGARLPSEAEWEKAARGTDGRLYPWGNKFDCSRGNFDDEVAIDDDVVPGGPGCDGYMHTAPVGSYPSGASPYRVLDMAGNVREWVADWYASDFYAHSPGRNPAGPERGDSRVLRGGAWDTLLASVPCAGRNWNVPTYRDNDVGFRCALSAR